MKKLLFIVLLISCGNDAETEDSDAGQDASITRDRERPNQMVGDDSSIGKVPHDAGKEQKKDAGISIPNPDTGINNPYACFIRGCAYPDVGCCWIGSLGGACLTNASCSVPGWERVGCICPTP